MTDARRRHATIRDVAREAHVSVASVSRVFSGADTVTEGVRGRVLAAARRLRYVPHSGARMLSTRRTGTLGVILPDLYGEFFSETIRGADLAARARGLHLLLSSSHDDQHTVAQVIRSLRGRVDGILVMSPHLDPAMLAENLAEDMPIVLLNAEGPVGDHPCFRVDNQAGAFAAVRHLLQSAAGVAHISGPASNREAEQRRQGYIDALGDHEALILPGDFTEEAGYAAGLKIADMTPRPQAVFAANDMMAIGCICALADRGVHVPEDVLVAGFDDIPMARLMRPRLTTVSARIAELSRRAVERLIGLVQAQGQDEGGADLEIVTPELIARESSIRSPARRDESGKSLGRTGL